VREAHEELLARVSEDLKQTAQWSGRSRLCAGVRAAMERVERDLFVSADQAAEAYANRPLPIGHGQTISQPFIVALMTELLNPLPLHRVLEIGTGSGYATAVIAEIVQEVYSIEVVEELAESARERLGSLGYTNVVVRQGDGYRGWAEHAPFDGILVTAAPALMPELLIEQLRPGGRMVLPIEKPSGGQELVVVVKDAQGHVQTRDVLPVAFVPMVSGG